jgi:hypothetical protein
MRYLLFFLLLVIVFSCNHKQKAKPVIIPEERFINLLMDYHLANAITYSNVFVRTTKKYSKYNIKDSVIRNHGYTKAIFDSTVAYYSASPDKYEIIYDSVITRINRIQARVEKDVVEKSEKARKLKGNPKINSKPVDSVLQSSRPMSDVMKFRKNLK